MKNKSSASRLTAQNHYIRQLFCYINTCKFNLGVLAHLHWESWTLLKVECSLWESWTFNIFWFCHPFGVCFHIGTFSRINIWREHFIPEEPEISLREFMTGNIFSRNWSIFLQVCTLFPLEELQWNHSVSKPNWKLGIVSLKLVMHWYIQCL